MDPNFEGRRLLRFDSEQEKIVLTALSSSFFSAGKW